MTRAGVLATSSPSEPYRLTRQTFRLAHLPIPDLVAYPLAWVRTRVYLRPRGHTVPAINASAAIARYRGPEAGPEGVYRLPWLMEDILDEWAGRKHVPNIKWQYHIHYGDADALEVAARAASQRWSLSPAETANLVQRYRSYVGELPNPPLPPLLYAITNNSRDHTRAMYEQGRGRSASRVSRSLVVKNAGSGFGRNATTRRPQNWSRSAPRMACSGR